MITLDYSTNTLKEWTGAEWKVYTFSHTACMEAQAAFIEQRNKELYPDAKPWYSDVDK